ncbi:G-patch-domain-containing protein [Auricularia subglabra TFB-10046 SS5]|uniref:G-patch-domain-containing protein n=1 Tax=Auricularia subglabra (strain TFB-10046 / SS5) TaxID=717982 RepID=J0LII4_AURST|nr:G-patch-domain-containing protein [Auricularia subglabra TFB-10046 SS5]
MRSRSSTALGRADPRAAIASLRRDMLAKHTSGPSTTSSSSYKDRAALRRAHAPEPPPLPAPSSGQASRPLANASPFSQPKHYPPVTQRAISLPPKPLSESNIGHQLLLKHGWTPGTGLGLSEDARLEPLPTIVLPERSGLGASSHWVNGAARSLHDSHGWQP